MYLSFRRARCFTAVRRMPELRAAFHSPRGVREAAVARVAVQFSQLEQVLISGPASAWAEQPLLDEPPDPRRRAVAQVLGSFCGRERPTLRPRHECTSNAATPRLVLPCR